MHGSELPTNRLRVARRNAAPPPRPRLPPEIEVGGGGVLLVRQADAVVVSNIDESLPVESWCVVFAHGVQKYVALRSGRMSSGKRQKGKGFEFGGSGLAATLFRDKHR